MSSNQTSKSSLYVSLFAGGTAHAVETAMFGHHIDRLMVQQQAFLHLRTIRESFQSVYQDGGWRGFYKGFKWNVFSSGARGAGGWGFLNAIHQAMSRCFPHKENAKWFNPGVAFGTAICETSLLLCPLERLKVLEMTSLAPLQLIKAARGGGRSFIYRGWNVMVLQRSLSWLSYLTFHQMAREKKETLSLAEQFLLGLGSGSFIALFSTPLDLIKTQKQMDRVGQAPRTVEIIRSVYQTYGVSGYFKGLSLRVIRTGWSGAVVITVLEGMNAFPKKMKS